MMTMTRKRRFIRSPLVPKDDLDYMLAAAFQINNEGFYEKTDVYRQYETLGRPTWRLLKNRCYKFTDEDLQFIRSLQKYGKPVSKPKKFVGYTDEENNPNTPVYHLKRRLELAGHTLRENGFGGHPLVYGGYPERVHTSSLKLGIVSNHSSQTNNAYIRKVDGSFFNS